jgi:hypothetical protein
MRITKRTTPFAFTLVEILLSVGILGMIMVAIYTSWNSILRGSKAGLDAAADAQRARIAMSTLESALDSIQMFEGSMKYYSFITDTSSDFAYLSFVAHLPASFPGSGLFGDQVMRRVTFSVETTNSQRQLVLRQMPMLQPLERGEEAYPIVLARDVNQFLLEFWAPTSKGWEWTSEWLYTNQIPKRVRVALAFGGKRDNLGSQVNEVVFRDIALPAMTVPRDWQMPIGTLLTPIQNTRTNLTPNPRVR